MMRSMACCLFAAAVLAGSALAQAKAKAEAQNVTEIPYESVGWDPQGNIFVSNGYVNNRVLKYDIGAPAALCITPGSHQYLDSSNSNPTDDIDTAGEIYKLEPNGQVVGKFGRAGKLPKEFGTVNTLNCRGENDLLVGELGNWRVQRLTLHP